MIRHPSFLIRHWPLLLAVASAAAAAQRQPWPDETPQTVKESHSPRSLPGLLMWLYSHRISQVDIIRTCRFVPTCGDYAREAIRRHGPWLGWLMGCERAIRYHGDRTTYRRVFMDGETRFLDPVEDNDFWLPRSPRRRPP